MDILIHNTTIVTVNKKREILYDSAIYINDGKIVDIGDTNLLESKYKNASKKINAKGKAVFPGLINTHNHLFQTLLKGMGDDKVLSDWLKDMTFPSAVHLMPESCYYGAMLGCIDGIRSGNTTVLDFMYPHPRKDLDDEVIRCFKDLKIRGYFGRGYMDTGESEGVQKGIMESCETIENEVVRVVEKYHNTENERVKIWLTPAAVWSNSNKSLELTKRLSEHYKLGVSTHISETPFDREATNRLHGAPDTDTCEKIGLMGENFLMVHCVHLTKRDIRMAKYYNAKVSHNPVSNMYLSSGVPPIPELNIAGVDVSLGVDGAASNNSNDMLEVLKFTALMQKVHHLDPTIITAEKVLEMATIEGARCIGMENEIGSLEIGKKADLFIFNPFKSAKATPMHHPVSTLVYSSSQNNVETVIIDGNFIMENGIILTIDETEMIEKGNEEAEKLSLRAGTKHLKYRKWNSLAF